MSRSRESCMGSPASAFEVAPGDGVGSGPVLMASQQGVPTSPLRVLEEALGMNLTAAGETADAVAAEGAYYLERILPEQAQLAGAGAGNGHWGRERGLPTGGRPLRLGASELARHLLVIKVASLPPRSPRTDQ